MSIHMGGAAALFLGVVLPATFAQTRGSRDWVKHPAVMQLDTQADIFAIGDVHGDCDRLVELLTGARIVQPNAPGGNVHWIADKATLVFTGDLIDKGPNAPAVIALVRSLSDQAERAGGRVIALMGNHENDFLRDPDSDKVRDFAGQIRADGLNPRTIAACGGDVGAFLCAMPFAARVGDWFFSHAGNTGGRTIGRLTRDLQTGVDRDGFGTPQLTDGNSLLAARLGAQGPGGKSWFETGGATQGADQILAANAAALGVAHIVQGHQHAEVRFPDGKVRKAGEMFQWHGRLFLIDTGMSREIDDSMGAVLHIRTGPTGEAAAICPDGRRTKLWDATQMPGAAAGVRCGAL